MTQRRPLVLVSGTFSELPQGDSVFGAAVTLAAVLAVLFSSVLILASTVPQLLPV